MRKLIVTAALVAFSAGVAQAAEAPAAASEAREIVLTVTARDFDGEAGQRRLMRRISGAAEELCGSYAAREPQDWREVDLCRRQVFRSAEQQIAKLKDGGRIRVAAR